MMRRLQAGTYVIFTTLAMFQSAMLLSIPPVTSNTLLNQKQMVMGLSCFILG